MKLFYPIFLLLISCSEPEYRDSEKDTIKFNQKTTSAFKDTAIAGCMNCIMSKKISQLTLKKNHFIYKPDTNCRNYNIKLLEFKLDSLKTEIEKLNKKYNLTEYTSQAKCSRLYPINHIRDTSIRDSLLIELAIWDNIKVPYIDTACGIPTYVNGKIAIKIKGKSVVFEKEEDYYEYLKKRIDAKKKLDETAGENKRNLTIQLTGIKEPDEYCIEIMRLYAIYIYENKYHEKSPFKNSGYANNTVFNNYLILINEK
jgi:hypothetical protein